MKCPLLCKELTPAEVEGSVFVTDCLKEECAWWDSTNSICALLQLSKSLYYMGLHIAQTEIKMPHFDQFRELRR